MKFRDYDAERDCAAVHRLWQEIGWIDKGEEAKLDRFLGVGKTIIGEVRGEVESLALTTPGTIRYLEEDLAFCCVASVTTSHVGRKQGLASRLTAESIASAAMEGALVAGLTMFEQGFYDQLGFGAGGYDHVLSFDPAQLTVPAASRPPHRLSLSNWEEVHGLRLKRRRGHGACNLYSAMVTYSDIEWAGNRFGLGYRDGPEGEISHYVWLDASRTGHGPYSVCWFCYQTREQFLELLGVLRNLGDQIHLLRMHEPASIQMQDFLHCPLKGRRTTARSEFEQRNQAGATLQLRVCDLIGCLAKTHLHCGSVRFNLRLNDPISAWLDERSAWSGVGGNYIVSLGSESQATVGTDPVLPTLSASVGAFTRMWLGVRPATGLAISDELTGPQFLLHSLDRILCLPAPAPDWDF
jgi:hypothetical protein